MKTLLAAIDFSQNTEPVIQQSGQLAKALKAKLWILHVTSAEIQTLLRETTPFNDFAPEFTTMPGDVQLARNLSAEEIKREHARLLSISAALRAEGVDTQALLLKGDAEKVILQKADELQADLIIIGSCGHGLLHKALIGSVSESLMRHTHHSILVVPMPKD